MPKAAFVLQLSRRLRSYAKDAATPRQRDDLRMAAALLERLAHIAEGALGRAARA
jgi:hypothetical protein